MHGQLPAVLISPSEIRERVRKLGARISADFRAEDAFRPADSNAGEERPTDGTERSLILVGVLKGALFFLADLSREISVPVQIEYMSVASYGKSTRSSGVVRILKDLDRDISGADVLLVEDIVDTGLTLEHLLRILESRRPRSLKVCSLLDKPGRRIVDLPIDYTGFSVPDEFVVGYGLDYDQRYRNLPYIAVLSDVHKS